MKPLTCLGVSHTLVRAREINASDLRRHLLDDHHISVQGVNTRGQLGRLHLLAHSLEAFPELKVLVLELKDIVKSL